MPLTRLIIHELEKEAGAINNSTIYLSDSLLVIDERSIGLITKLNRSFTKDGGLSYARFNTAPDRYFPSRFETYKTSGMSDDHFIDFTVDATNMERTDIVYHPRRIKVSIAIFIANPFIA